MEKKQYKISLDGCDDSTEIEVLLSGVEQVFLEELVKKINKNATYGCKPSMSLEEVK